MPAIPAITGLGLVTPLGADANATWQALLGGEFIRDHARVRDLDASDESRVNVLALRAAWQAVREAGWSNEQRGDAALVVGTSKGPVEQWLRPPPYHMACIPYDSVGRLGGFGLSETAAATARELGLRHGARLTLSAACASGLHALIRGAMMIREGVARRVLVVASESSVHPLFIHSFRRLGLLPPEGEGCRPFDQTRAGFLLSEGAAAVCLEDADAGGRRATTWVDRFSLAGDATHLTGSDPGGETLRRVLAAALDARGADLIHAHGTGTILNDPVELAAIDALITGNDAPIVYSHKGALGHSLGAAGLVSVVLNCLCHRHGLIPGNVQTHQPLHAERAVIAQQVISRRVRRSVAVAAGFGGATAAVSLLSP